MTFLRSALFALVFVVVTILVSIVLMIFVRPLPLSTRFRVISRVNRFFIGCGRWICGVRYEVSGLENLPKDQPYVLLANHQSEWETFFLQVLVGELCTVLKKELLDIPFFGWGLALVDPIAIDRSERSGALKQILRKGKARLEKGVPVLLFPQGTRLPPGKVGRLNKGGAMLACASGVPVVPLVHDAGRCWPSKTFLKYPGVIRVEIGEPMATEGRTVDEVNEYIRVWISERVAAQQPLADSEKTLHDSA